ncbi:DNA-formamidopyrimidine glycosylase family protein [Edaphocola aurantiacus]|uniref:DNA-formamidopyrimidine glycosylase family protein n=1 Tax=Edaphocola aurantiacus TaxID=2601682 RepID=UPI001C976BD8|nr:DNA-formamidopyrimidine glycosylase family protein [Edaphocola aurantiacus]
MPEGPSILLMKEELLPFAGQKIISVSGNARIELQWLQGKKLSEIKSLGKQLFLVCEVIVVRIHLLLFGSYSVNEKTKSDKSLRLCLQFKEGSIYFYTCSVKLHDLAFLDTLPWEADVLSDNWLPAQARKKLKALQNTMVCDALLNQDIFAGVGNIIKNEVLFRIGVHPESIVSELPDKKLTLLIKEARQYSFDFLNWKRDFVLKQHWLVHTRKTCPKCGTTLTKKYTGKTHRRSFFCTTDQQLYDKHN